MSGRGRAAILTRPGLGGPATVWGVSRYVTASLRCELYDRLPGLVKDAGYPRLLVYLLSGGQRDEETGETVIPARLLAEFGGVVTQYEQNNFDAGAFLRAFQRDVLPGFRFSDKWSKVEKKARVVTRLGVPEEVLVLWADAAGAVARGEEKAVDVVSGRVRTRQTAVEDDLVDLMTVEKALKSNPGVADATRAVIGYHNSQSPKAFSSAVRRRMPEALAVAEGLEKEKSLAATLAALDSIGLFPKPLLKPVESSARAFSVRPSLLTVKGKVRRVFTQDWVDYDLKSAQFAIVAKEWRIPELQEFLASGASVWQTLSAELGLPAAKKKSLKDATYSLVFGGERKGIADAFDKDSGIPGIGNRFLSLPLIQCVYRAREREMDHLLDTAYEGWTALGKRIPIPSVSDRMKRKRVARSILAQQAQALELLLLMPVYGLASETDQFQVMLYQFDGFTVKYRDRRSCAFWHRRIIESVDSNAQSFGIQTRLDCEPGASFNWPLE